MGTRLEFGSGAFMWFVGVLQLHNAIRLDLQESTCPHQFTGMNVGRLETLRAQYLALPRCQREDAAKLLRAYIGVEFVMQEIPDGGEELLADLADDEAFVGIALCVWIDAISIQAIEQGWADWPDADDGPDDDLPGADELEWGDGDE